MNKTFSHTTDFSIWLDENHWFEHGYCLEFSRHENSNSLLLKLAYQIEGSYEAYTERRLRVFSIKAEGIKGYSKSSEEHWSADHCMDGFELNDDGNPIKFSIDIPQIINVECERIIVSESEEVVDTVKPWLSDTEIFVTVGSEELPNPNDWLLWLNEFGHDLGWRYYTGELKDVACVPVQSYDGWYLQEKRLISKSTQGLFFRHCKKETNGFSLSCQSNELNSIVWHSFKKLLLRFNSIEIHCGNCKFINEQWKKCLHA
ncbi:MAG: hypothetical protein HRT38_18305 [Alteromonadaceae bacterium]|nr:hypothetical protein [Alteromonadaceae bacterium]